MCFTIHYRYPKPRVAKKDIVCYKVVYAKSQISWKDQGYRSLFQNFGYKTGMEYSLRKEPGIRTVSCFIYEGFHSYSNKKRLRKWKMPLPHLKCIIPAGSTYYYNPDDQVYVSDRIRVVEEISK